MKKLLITVAFLIVVPSFSSADIVFDNFRTDGPAFSLNSYAITYEPGIRDVLFATPFTTTTNDYYLDSLTLGLTIENGNNEVDIWLMTDNNGLPGTSLESFHISDALPQYSRSHSYFPLVSMTSVVNPLLTEGSKYWIAMSPTGLDSTRIHWHTSRYYVRDDYAYKLNSSDPWTINNYEMAAFSVTGSPVAPEPVSSLLFIIGSGVLYFKNNLIKRSPHA